LSDRPQDAAPESALPSRALLAGRRRVTWTGPALVLSNAVPLLGVLFFEWDTFLVVYLFWCENLILGVCNLLRMAFACGEEGIAQHIVKPLVAVFFIVHYGMFTVAHGSVILSFFGAERLGWENAMFGSDFFGPVTEGLIQLWPEIWVGFLALSASHLFSFFVNYLGGGEYRRTKVEDTMTQPYRRVVVLHLAVCFGALAVAAAGNLVGLLALLVVIKTAVDLRAHWKEHAVVAVAP
jgi:hypothetical protein